MQKRSSLFIIGALLLLIGISIFIYLTKGKTSTMDEDSRSFKIKDTASITKIFIADKNGNKSLLQRTAKGWVVNNKFACRTDAILNLMEVIKHVDVKMTVPKQAIDATLKTMSANAIKVEIYAGEDLIKQYYVGHEPQGAEGSYLLLTNTETGENYKDPYLCCIPGFVGFLKPRYIANENEWRDRVVINYTPPQLRQIKVDYYNLPDSSFAINLLNTTTFKLVDTKNKELAFNETKLRQYIAYYQNLSYEFLFTGQDKRLEDSLALQKPFCKITIVGNGFSNSEYKFYYKTSVFTAEQNGVTYKYDPDRLYLKFANDKEWALIQYFVFGKLLITPLYFKN